MPITGSGILINNDGSVKTQLQSSTGTEVVVGTPGFDSVYNAGISTNSSLYGFNGGNFDRWRNNTQHTLLVSGARSSSTNTPYTANFNATGVHVVLKITASSGTGGLLIKIIGQTTSGAIYQMNVTPPAVTAIGTYAYELYPGSSGLTTPEIMQRTSGSLPRIWNVYVSHLDASSYTYSLEANVIL